jgi:hypothetical protein
MELHCINLGLLLPGLLPTQAGISNDRRTDSTAQRAFDETHAGQDVPERDPVTLSLPGRLLACLAAAMRGVARRGPVRQPRLTSLARLEVTR